MNNYKYWIGSSGFLNKEVDNLLYLLSEIRNKKSNLMLNPEISNDFYWIGNLCEQNKNYKNFPIELGNIALKTSGTTGNPKIIWKNLEDVINSKKGQGQPDDLWLLTYNPARWAGLSVILHTIKNNSKLIVPNSFAPSDILNKINNATHISITPSLFRKLQIIDHKKLSLANIKQITFGGEYATQKILNEAKTIWPEANITHIYATTELGDVFSCNDKLEGFPLNKIKSEYHLLENGELVFNGNNTGDIWYIKNNRLYFVGRMNESINVGGLKVTGTFIENNVNNISGVFECRAYAINSPLLGQVVSLDYVGNIEPIDLKKILLKILPKYAVPIKINKVTDIVLTTAGKITRII